MHPSLSIALAIAAHNLPVFPCSPSKRPAIAKDRGGNGYLDACTEPAAVTALFERAPFATLVGVPTGELSGFDVLDVDPRHGGDVWERENAHRLPDTLIHGTLNGGRHYFFRHAPGVRNSADAKRIAPGIDIRGSGGYVCFPDSPGYSVINEAPIAEWPDWLLKAVLARDVAAERPPDVAENMHGPMHGGHLALRASRYCEAMLRSVSAAADGNKHFTLRNTALLVGGYLHLTGWSVQDAVASLVAALPASVQDWKAATATATWAVTEGQRRPLELPERYRPAGPGPQHKPNSAGGPQPHAEAYSSGTDAGTGPEPDDRDVPPASDTIPFFTFSEVNEAAQIDDFVEDLLITGAMSVIYGPTNCGKTFLALDLALHVAAGIPWRDQAIDRGAVLYIALEGGQQAIRNRILAVKEHQGWTGYDLPFAVITTPINLLDPHAHIEPLIRTVRAIARRFVATSCPVRWIIIDTLARALAGGNENASEDMGALVLNCDRLRAETACHLSLLHHSGKDEARGARGHSLLTGATDTEIEIIDREGIRSVTITKQRDLPTIDCFAFMLKSVEIGTNRRGKPITTCLVVYEGTPTQRAAKRPAPTHADRALEILTDLCAAEGQTGHAGAPNGYATVPAKWWRERFYDRAMPGEDQDTKKHAFARATKLLIGNHKVGMTNDRVWVPSHD